MRYLPHSLLAAGAVIASAGCPGSTNVQCSEQSNCDLTPGGTCVEGATGNQWCAYPDPNCPGGMRYSDFDVGDGLSGLCVADDADARTTDAATDAGVDAPWAPLITNFQPAEIVLGQPNFSTATDRGVAANSIQPIHLACGGDRLWASDRGLGRVLGWDPLPQTSDVSANRVLGRTNFTDSAAVTMVTAANLGEGAATTGMAVTNDALLASDEARNRVLIWRPLPTTNGQASNLALGQQTLTDSAPGSAANQLRSPSGLWSDGTRVIVADTQNNRVLVWNTFPTTNGQAADVVIGQPNFGISAYPPAPLATNMRTPTSVFYDGVRLYVTDFGFGRILVWNSLPAQNGRAADFVIGRDSLTSNGGGSPDADTLGGAGGVAVARDTLFVADVNADRILAFAPIPTSSGAAAVSVLGQANPGSIAVGQAPSQTSMSGPWSICITGDKLFVSDFRNRRITRFDLNL